MPNSWNGKTRIQCKSPPSLRRPCKGFRNASGDEEAGPGGDEADGGEQEGAEQPEYDQHGAGGAGERVRRVAALEDEQRNACQQEDDVGRDDLERFRCKRFAREYRQDVPEEHGPGRQVGDEQPRIEEALVCAAGYSAQEVLPQAGKGERPESHFHVLHRAFTGAGEHRHHRGGQPFIAKVEDEKEHPECEQLKDKGFRGMSVVFHRVILSWDGGEQGAADS